MSTRDLSKEIPDVLQFRRLGKKPHIIVEITPANGDGLFSGRVDVSKIPPMLTDKDLEELLAQVNEEFTKRKGGKSVNVLAS